MDSKKPLTGVKREAALSELRGFIDEQLPLEPPIDSFQTRLDAYDEETKMGYFSVYHRLFSTITLDEGVFEHNPRTATPGDPRANEMYDGEPYIEAALAYMLGKLDTLARQVGVDTMGRGTDGLTTEDYEAIYHEIVHQHDIQVLKNQTSFQRLKDLFMADFSSINEWRSIIALMARSTDADIVMHAMLLNWYPEIDSIEDLKQTCLFDRKAYLETKRLYKENLRALSTRSWGRFTATIFPEQTLEPRPRHLADNISSNVRASKTVIAEISDKEGMTFEVVEKLNEYALPADRELYGVEPNMVGDENVQPVYVQYYLRVKRNRGDDSEDEQLIRERDYNVNTFYIIEHGIRRAIHDLRNKPKNGSQYRPSEPDILH